MVRSWKVRAAARRGVTLTELLVVIAIVGVLASLSFVLFTSAVQYADRVEDQVARVKQRNDRPREVRKDDWKKPKPRPDIIANQYIITFKPGVTDPRAEAFRLGQMYVADVLQVYTGVFKGCALLLRNGGANSLRLDPAIASVSADRYAYSAAEITPNGVRRIRAAVAPKQVPYRLVFPVVTTSNSNNPTSPGSPGTSPSTGRSRNMLIGPLPSSTPGTDTTLTLPGSDLPLKNVVVMDSGIDSDHPDLNVTLEKDFTTSRPSNRDSHGTNVAGIIGARENGVGVIGVFPGVPLWSFRVLDDRGRGQTSDIIAALDDVANNAASVSVVNISIATKYSQALNDAVDRVVDAGVVVVVAAGNDADNITKTSPASAPKAICVAALCDTDGRPGGKGRRDFFGGRDDTFAAFSNWGSSVTFVAPGVDIYTTDRRQRYDTVTGTSYAAPHVAGLAALVIENGRRPGLSQTPTPNQQTTPVPSQRNLLLNRNPSSDSGGDNPNNVGETPLPPVTTPTQVRDVLLQMAVEQIPGRYDNRTYPLITGRP